MKHRFCLVQSQNTFKVAHHVHGTHGHKYLYSHTATGYRAGAVGARVEATCRYRLTQARQIDF